MTTMPESSPWDDIAVPGADFNVRQVAVGTAVPCFWGRDAGGACLFIVELHGDHAAQYRKNAVTVNGIDVDLRAGDQGQQHLVRSEEHTSELQSLMRISYAVFCLKKKKTNTRSDNHKN